MRGEQTTHLYLVRHGRTDWNALRRIQGRIERDLDEEGKKEAQDAALLFSKEALSAIYSSGMRRAYDTAQIIATYHNFEVQVIEELHEGSYGACEGMFVHEFEKKWEEALEKKKQLPLAERLQFKLADDMETDWEIVQRTLPHLHHICKKHLGEKVLIVSHGWVMRALILSLEQIKSAGCLIRNGGSMFLEGNGEFLRVIDYKNALVQHS